MTVKNGTADRKVRLAAAVRGAPDGGLCRAALYAVWIRSRLLT